jgi:hypothetical protein
MGQMYFRKVAENFGQCGFSQHAKSNMAGFVLCLRGSLGLRFRIAGVCPKALEIELPMVEKKEILQMSQQTESRKPLTNKQFEQHQQSGVSERAEVLLKRIGEACDELERLAEENPELVGRVTVGAEEHKEAYLRLKARLALADSAPRCRWVHQDGTTCGSPQMKRHIYCFAHKQMAEAQALALRLPALEDANAIMIGIMRIQKALIDGTISTKTAGLLLYSMQLALQSVGKTTFGQVKGQELVRETVDESEAISSQQSAFSQTRFTTEDTEDAEEGKTLPLMNVDDHESARERRAVSEPWPKQVEWKPTPDMYRTDTQEGIEAYEASFRMKIRPQLDRAGTPPRAAVPHELGRPHEHAESRINRG